MPIANMLSITSNPFLSMLIWIALLLAALFFARKPFHRAIGAICKILHNAMRLTAASVLSAEKRLVRHNREVLMAAGLEKSERLEGPGKFSTSSAPADGTHHPPG